MYIQSQYVLTVQHMYIYIVIHKHNISLYHNTSF